MDNEVVRTSQSIVVDEARNFSQSPEVKAAITAMIKSSRTSYVERLNLDPEDIEIDNDSNLSVPDLLRRMTLLQVLAMQGGRSTPRMTVEEVGNVCVERLQLEKGDSVDELTLGWRHYHAYVTESLATSRRTSFGEYLTKFHADMELAMDVSAVAPETPRAIENAREISDQSREL